MADGPPRASAIRLRDLTRFGVIRQIGHEIFEHLTSSSFLHSGEFRRRIRSPLGVHDLGEDPLPEHGALRKHRLLPQVGLVSAYFIPSDHRDLVSRRLESDVGTASHHDERVKKVTLDAARRESRVVGLEEDDADDVVADMALPLKLKVNKWAYRVTWTST